MARPADRLRLLSAAAAPARLVLDVPDATPASGEDVSFAVLHGLYWQTANLAGEQGLLLCIDDLHWCDAPSLRFVAYLARRLEGVGAAGG